MSKHFPLDPPFGRLHAYASGTAVGAGESAKGIAYVRLEDGTVVRAEVHWYEAHGIGRRGLKIKRIID